MGERVAPEAQKWGILLGIWEVADMMIMIMMLIVLVMTSGGLSCVPENCLEGFYGLINS